MKAYTDLEQSKKLAKILPLESADMHYVLIDSDQETYSPGLEKYYGVLPSIPCWSLAALLEEVPDTIINMVSEGLKLHIDKDGFQYSLFYENEYTGNMFEIETEWYDDMIDACYEMILKLH